MTERAPRFAPITVERADFEVAAAAADLSRVAFRSVGHLPLVALLLGLSVWGYLSDQRLQTIHCRRDTGSCVIASDGPFHHERTSLELSQIQRAQVVEVATQSRAERAIELATDAGPLRFELTESCRPPGPCPETLRVSRQIQRFLDEPTAATLDASYGPFGSIEAAIALALMALLFGAVQLERVVLVVSARRGQVLILDEHLLGKKRYRALPLDDVATCMLDYHGEGRRRRELVSLVSTSGEHYPLTRSGPLQGWLRRLFVRQVIEALLTARA